MASTGRRDDRSEAAQAYRKLYRTKRWLQVRKAQLSVHPLCAMCLEDGQTTAATVCDHADKDSKATEEGFFAGPFNSLCKAHHDSTRQREERSGHVIGCDVNGWPRDAGHHWHKA
jgi:5-methylcytosine-specific restriction protein A